MILTHYQNIRLDISLFLTRTLFHKFNLNEDILI